MAMVAKQKKQAAPGVNTRTTEAAGASTVKRTVLFATTILAGAVNVLTLLTQWDGTVARAQLEQLIMVTVAQAKIKVAAKVNTRIGAATARIVE